MLGDKSKSVLAPLIVILASLGVARAAAAITGGASYTATVAIGGLAAWILLAGLLSGMTSIPRLRAARSIAWAFSPALLSWAVPLLLAWFGSRQWGISFSQVGALRLGGEWIHVSPPVYLATAVLGLGLMGALLALTALFWRLTRACFVAAAVAAALAGTWRVFVFPPSGDEPYMLLSAISVLHDGNLDLRDEFREGDARNVHPVSFEEDFLAVHSVPGRKGAFYNRHGILIPLIYAPGYALAGRIGVQVLLAIFWGLLLAQIYRLLISTGYDDGTSHSAVGLLAIASPLPLFAVFMGPDLLCALLLAIGLFALVRDRPAAILACVALLPWIHHKAALLSAGLVLSCATLYGLKRGAAGFVVLAASLSLLTGVLMKFTDVTAWPPWAVMSFSAVRYQERFSIANIPTSLLATLFDRHQGLVYFPALFLVFAGAALQYRRAPRIAAALAAASGPYLAALLLYSQWHGGPGAPGRLLVLLLPAVALPLAAFVDASRRTGWGRRLNAGLYALGGLTVWLLASCPAFAFVSAKRRAERLLGDITGFNPFSWFPDLSGDPPALRDHILALPWLLLLILFSVFLARSLKLRAARAKLKPKARETLRRRS